MAVEDWPPLVGPADLADFPGAPFSEAVVRSAASSVRDAAGWHIAPTLTETVTLDHDGGRVLHLPSLYVSGVESVRDVTTSTPREVTGWRWSGAGMLEGHFPAGFRAVEVTFTHGYEICPPSLHKVIATRAQRRVVQEAIGGRSVTLANEDGMVETDLARYRLGPRP